MNRRRFITASGIVGTASLAGYSMLVEPDLIEFTYHAINGSSDYAFRFAQISDLHLKTISRQHERIGIQLSKENLDLIIITGDSIDSNGQLQILDHFMSMLKSSIPKYAILGNWEHWGGVSVPKLADVYSRWNCDLLVNRSAQLNLGDRSILVTGLDDFIGGVPSPTFALKDVEPQEDHFLLAHCPQYLDKLLYFRSAEPLPLESHKEVDLKQYSFSNIFSGHTHGGQINLLGMTPFVPQGSGRYIKGWFNNNGHQLFVSRGVGTSILPVRIGSVPEIAIFEYFFKGKRQTHP